MQTARVLLGVVFIVGVIVRLPSLGDPPSLFHTDRQYYTAIHAQELADPWLDRTAAERAADHAASRDVFQLEAPLQSYAVAFGWIVLRGTPWWWPRLLSIAGYLVGAIAIAGLLRRRAGQCAAVVGASVFLFTPFGLALSRSIQPDALMVGFTCLAVDIGDRLVDRPTWRRAIGFALAASGAVLLKGVALFAIGPIVLLFASDRRWVRLRDRRVIASLCVLAAATIWYYVPEFVSGDLRAQGAGSVIPSLLGRVAFYQNWIAMLLRVVGPVSFAVVPVAIVWSRGAMRKTIAGWSLGYLGFALLYDYRSATHDYYAALFIPAVAMAAGVVAEQLWVRSNEIGFRRVIRPAVLGILTIGLVNFSFAPSPTNVETPPAVARAVGDAVHHGTRVIFEAPDYAYPLRFDAHVAGFDWEGPADLQLERLAFGKAPSASEELAAMRHLGAHQVVFIGQPRQWDPALKRLVAGDPVTARGDGWEVRQLLP